MPNRPKRTEDPADTIGRVRRSQMVGAWGPGAVIDLRLKSGAPVSGVIAGLEDWDRSAPDGAKGSLHPQVIFEARLQARLGKKGFRLPPVRGPYDPGNTNTLPVQRFPQWLQCPSCSRIKAERHWAGKIGNPDRWCADCQTTHNRQIPPVPVRFIVACEAGHLDEFPFKWWAGCKCDTPSFILETTGAGLAGKHIRCTGCNKSKSLEGAFAHDALSLRRFECKGKRPWLPGAPPEAGCKMAPRVLQRGASNVYWGVTESALDIPPYSVDIEQIVGRFWPVFQNATEDKWPGKVEALELEQSLNMPAAAILKTLKEWKDGTSSAKDDPLLWREYQMFQKALKEHQSQGHFDVAPEKVPDEFTNHLAGVGAASRLREVRVLTGFTRIHPPGGTFGQGGQVLTPIAQNQQALDWLPGIELRGEGIFIGLHPDRVEKWESNPAVRKRQQALEAAVKKDLREDEQLPDCSPRFLLLHTLAHAVIRQLSLECGYSSSALRERIYAGVDPTPMLGVLIQTGSPDSEGTLGGLVRRARVDLFSETLTQALKSQIWCSSDPLCISGAATLSSPRNRSACHACQLVPETSCTHFNVLLDRALLVGTDAEPDIGFFGALIRSI